ncbi:MAG TPA: hypothetical protein VKG64_14835 [Methylomirabilota bacterium]|jgi:hypothetical protein|nr:hypothetical protein [Methylomirabilota bacterium]
MRRTLALSLLLAAAVPAGAAGDQPAEEIRPRVEHHLRAAADIAGELEPVLTAACPRFASREAWDAYLDGSVERVVTMVAHLDQAWEEAKRTGDKDVRREAKAPRRRLDQAQRLVAKLHACADGNGARFAPGAVWRRIERAVPQRQSEIALPQ